jgi:hypothetical protein
VREEIPIKLDKIMHFDGCVFVFEDMIFLVPFMPDIVVLNVLMLLKSTYQVEVLSIFEDRL